MTTEIADTAGHRREDVIRHRIGTCPACRGGLWGQVRVRTLTAAPSLADDGKASAYARAHAFAMDLDHHCSEETR